ncbi:MAG: glycosyltransferase [Calditrichaceae bacterium]
MMKPDTKIVILTISDLIYEANLHRKVMTLKKQYPNLVVLATRNRRLDLNIWEGINLQFLELRFKKGLLYFAEFFLKSLSWVLRQKADLFISYDVYPLLPLRIKKIIHPCNYIYDSVELFQGVNAIADNPVKRKIWFFYEKWAIGKASDIFMVCKSDATYLRKIYRLENEPEVVRNIPDPSETFHENYLRVTYGVPADIKIGIYQGMVFKGRGIEYILKAMAGISGMILFIVGDGPYKDYLKNLTREYRLKKSVVFIHAVPFNELYKFTQSADIGFTTIAGKGLSYYHALPNKLFEYIQAGVPVIGSNYPEIRNIIEKEEIGYAVKPDSVEEIKEAIRKMLINENRQRFEKKLEKIKGKYTWEKESEIYLDIIRRNLDGTYQRTEQFVPENDKQKHGNKQKETKKR